MSAAALDEDPGQDLGVFESDAHAALEVALFEAQSPAAAAAVIGQARAAAAAGRLSPQAVERIVADAARHACQ